MTRLDLRDFIDRPKPSVWPTDADARRGERRAEAVRELIDCIRASREHEGERRGVLLALAECWARDAVTIS